LIETEIEVVEELCVEHCNGGNPEAEVIPLLQKIQDSLGYLTKTSLSKVAERLRLPPSRVFGVATFYHQFRLRPQGKHIVTVCRGTACHVAGVTKVYDELMKLLDVSSHGDTSPDGLFTVHQVRCIGACSLAPVIKVDDHVYGRLDQERLREILDSFKE
jgi:NADH:ubiquinone oxidoreductase subunit E